MTSCQRILATCLVSLLAFGTLGIRADPLPLPSPTVHTQRLQVEEPHFVVISEDVISDVENTTQKVIRVNPLDLPSVKADPTTGSADSSLYKIQSLLPAQRNYVNSNRMRKPRPRPGSSGDSPIIRHLPGASDSPIMRHLPGLKPFKSEKPHHKQKHLHFLYNQEALDGHLVSKTMRVHVAPGAYPVYYAVSKANGRFGKYPIKNFRNQEDFVKYLAKSKLQPIEMARRYES